MALYVAADFSGYSSTWAVPSGETDPLYTGAVTIILSTGVTQTVFDALSTAMKCIRYMDSNDLYLMMPNEDISIINLRSKLLILENTFISSHVVISGGCKIGKNCFFGVNSSVADGIKINDFCSIFMNTSVSKNLDIRSIVVSKNSEIIIEDDKKNKVITNKFYK